MEKINFIFFGRFETSKGFDLLMNLIKYMYEDKIEKRKDIFDKVNFFIFGDGNLRNFFLTKFIDIVEDFSTKTYDDQISFTDKNVYYFGWKDNEFIKKYLSVSHYMLMPSVFLETFGLSALESVSMGVPVIGFAKGGLENFIFEQLDISKAIGFSSFERFYNLISDIVENFDIKNWQILSEKSKQIAQNYSTEKWIENASKIFNGQKILIVSDYIQKIGGIETYIYKSKEILEKNGKQVEIFGWNGLFGHLNNLVRKVALPFVGFNFIYSNLIKKQINKLKPDTIRVHSISRFLGWKVLDSIKNFKGKKIIMYHDFGFCHPYPSKVADLQSLYRPFGFLNFIKSAKTFNIIKLFLVLLKFLSVYLIRKEILKVFDIHLVPSDYMTKVLEYYGVPKEKIIVLNHFKD